MIPAAAPCCMPPLQGPGPATTAYGARVWSFGLHGRLAMTMGTVAIRVVQLAPGWRDI